MSVRHLTLEAGAGSAPATHGEPVQLQVSHWFNAPAGFSLEHLRGQVVAIEVFQMLCPGCVSHGLPQLGRLAHAFQNHSFQVMGLHSVFEHHAGQGTKEALEAFLHEYRLTMPVAMDAPSDNDRLPKTMRALDLPGTPTLLLLDREGRERARHFGRIDDMALGAQVMALLLENPISEQGPSTAASSATPEAGDSQACRVDGTACS